jgi:hypothetical protein
MTFCRILRGEASFRQLKKDILGPLEFAWNLIEIVVQRREREALHGGAMPELLREFPP